MIQADMFPGNPEQCPPPGWKKRADYNNQMTIRRLRATEAALSVYQKGDRVVFRPYHVYPFTYGWNKTPSRHYPKNNKVEGTVVSTFAPLGELDIRIDKALPVTRERKRVMMDVVVVRMNSIIEHIPQARKENQNG